MKTKLLDFLPNGVGVGYKISDSGLVWTRWIRRGCGMGFGSRYELGTKWKLMAMNADSFGYHRVRLGQQPNTKDYRVHTLVLLAFVGPRPDRAVCRHYPDPNPANNNSNNLQWGTCQENSLDSVKGGQLPIGEKCHWAKLTEKQVIQIRRMHAANQYSRRELSKLFNTSPSNVGLIVRRVNWKHI